MNEEELIRQRRIFEDADIQFVREDEPGTGPRVGGILERVTDPNGNDWIAIGQGVIDSDLTPLLREILQWVANRGF